MCSWKKTLKVAIVGEFDCTNFISSPIVVDAILGNTIQKIAWNKSGILKDTVPALTVNQELAGINVLTRRAKGDNVSSFEAVLILECLERISTRECIKLGVPGCVKLCQKWIQISNGKVANGRKLNWNPCQDELTTGFVTGLENCRWPGRYHTLQRNVGGRRLEMQSAKLNDALHDAKLHYSQSCILSEKRKVQFLHHALHDSLHFLPPKMQSTGVNIVRLSPQLLSKS